MFMSLSHSPIQTHLVLSLNFNTAGDLLIGNHNDRVTLWDWEPNCIKLSFEAGHDDGILTSQFMPYTNDDSILTCSLDGKVRYSKGLNGAGRVESRNLGVGAYRATDIVCNPDTPNGFLACCKDGKVLQFDCRCEDFVNSVKCVGFRDDLVSFRLGTIDIAPRHPLLFAVGGSEAYVQLFDIRKCSGSRLSTPVGLYCPTKLRGSISEDTFVTSLKFTDSSDLVVSYWNDDIYLFDQSMSVKCSEDFFEKIRGYKQVYSGHRHYNEETKMILFGAGNGQYVMSGSDCGGVYVWKQRDGELIQIIEANGDMINRIAAHPELAAICGSGYEGDIKLWTPKAAEKAVLRNRIEQRPYERMWMNGVRVEDELMDELFSRRAEHMKITPKSHRSKIAELRRRAVTG